MKTRLRDEQIWLVTVSLMILAAVAVAASLAYTRAVMVPFVLAIFIATVVSPVVDFLQVRWRISRTIAILAALTIVVVILAIFGLLSVVAIQTMVETAGEYSESFVELAKKPLDKLKEWKVPIDEGKIAAEMGSQLPALVTRAVGTATGLFSTGFLIVIFVVFLLAGRSKRTAESGIYAEIESTIRRYIATKIAISSVTGILVWIILASFGLRMAPLFAMLAFVLNFIPSIGSVVATVLPIPVAVAQFTGFWSIFGVVALPGAVQMIIGNVIDPKLMGQELKLHPVTILMSLAFWGLLWGPVGMVMAVPITASIRIVLMQFETTKPIANLFAGKLPEADS